MPQTSGTSLGIITYHFKKKEMNLSITIYYSIQIGDPRKMAALGKQLNHN